MFDVTIGGETPPKTHIYTRRDFAKYARHQPLLIDRLGSPGDGKRNRLILSRSLREVPQPPQLTPDELLRADWQRSSRSTNTDTVSRADDRGDINAVRH